MKVSDSAEALLKLHEGLRLFPYICPSGKLTIGYGRNLTDKGISMRVARFMLTVDVDTATRHLETDARTRDTYKALDGARQVVLVDMSVNLGFVGLLGFKRMWLALESGDFEQAAAEILDSVYAKQLPARSQQLAGIMKDPEMLLEALEGDNG